MNLDDSLRQLQLTPNLYSSTTSLGKYAKLTDKDIAQIKQCFADAGYLKVTPAKKVSGLNE